MLINHLSISNWRNIEEFSETIGEGANIFFGENGAGKTNLIEAVYTLAHTKSFRPGSLRHMIAHQSNQAGILCESNCGREKIKISKASTTPIIMQRNDQRVTSRAAWVLSHPVLIWHQKTMELVLSGSESRRQYLDWLAFHVKPEFQTSWAKYQKLLQQRNALLKTGCLYSDLAPWDELILQCAGPVAAAREEVFMKAVALFESMAEACALPQVSFELIRGWKGSLECALKEGFNQDLSRGYSNYGPHRANMSIQCGGLDVRYVLSRGQLKLLVCLLLVIQAKIFYGSRGLAPLFLLDDLPSELDARSLQCFFSLLKELKPQILLTSVDNHWYELLSGSIKMFHVKHGAVSVV